MHVQARARVKASVHGQPAIGGSAANVSLSEVLGILADGGFSLRAASGHDIETGGEFSFWVHPRKDDDGQPIEDEHEAMKEAIKLLKKHHVQVQAAVVYEAALDDDRGTLQAFVDKVTAAGRPVVEISVGTPNEDGKIPVQIWTGESLA